jgi:hypothetical protein
MVQIVMALLRVFVGLLLGCVGVLGATAGLYFVARHDARLFGSEGVLLLLGLTVGAVFGIGSWKLLRNALRLRAAA